MKSIKSIKCVVVGDGAVGKTSMLIRYVQGTFPTDYIPTIFENYVKQIVIDKKAYNLQLWDTAGQEEYQKLRPMSYPETNVFLLCFSLVSPSSLENISAIWSSEVRTAVPNSLIILVGTKMDMRDSFSHLAPELIKIGDKPISFEEGKNVADSINATAYIECSAFDGRNLTEVFETAVKVVLFDYNNKIINSTKKEKSFCNLL